MTVVRYMPWREVGARPNIVVDGAPLRSTVLTLSHWPNNATPERYRRETSTETVFAWLERHDPARVATSVATIVTNNHYDEDGLFSMFALTAPRRALALRDLLADAARTGDFGTCRSRDAVRLCAVIEAYADPQRSPLPRRTFAGPESARTAALYRAMLPLLPRLVAELPTLGRYWRDGEAHLAASEALIAGGRAAIEEEPELDLAIIRVPEECEPRPVWRYLRREEHALHPFAIHGATRCGRLVRIQGRRIEFQYRYESWLAVPSRRPAMRVDLAPFCRWLNRRERHGEWTWEDTLDIAPRLRLAGGAASSISPEAFLRALRRALATLPPAWDPYNWPRRAA